MCSNTLVALRFVWYRTLSLLRHNFSPRYNPSFVLPLLHALCHQILPTLQPCILRSSHRTHKLHQGPRTREALSNLPSVSCLSFRDCSTRVFCCGFWRCFGKGVARQGCSEIGLNQSFRQEISLHEPTPSLCYTSHTEIWQKDHSLPRRQVSVRGYLAKPGLSQRLSR